MKKLSFLILFLFELNLFANPQNPNVIAGEVNFNEQASNLQINSHSDRSIIDWESFSINVNELTQFIQPGITSAILNRVKGIEKSQIDGMLKSNASIYLINPNGVIVGREGIINTAALITSTLDISNDQFLEGKDLLFSGDSKNSIINNGTIHASDSDVILIAYKIENEGTIQTPQGTTALGCGQKVLVKLKSDPLISINPNLDSESLEGTAIDLSGDIQALNAELKVNGPYALAMNLSGTIEASNIVEQNGKIYLKADDGKVEISGTLKADRILCESNDAVFHKESLVEAPQGNITINSSNWINLEGTIVAKEGNIEINNMSESQRMLLNTGLLDVSGEKAGDITITSSGCLNSGKVLANSTNGNGGNIKLDLQEIGFIETSSALFSAISEFNGDGGTIEIFTGPKRLFTSGNYQVTSSEQSGGSVSFLGNDIALVATDIDASGKAQGGEILIGGDYQGNNPSILNATFTHINHATNIKADAINGDGGKVIVWSNEKTEFYGSISAGSLQKGNGGLIEISSKDNLLCSGSTIAKAGALSGNPGTVLLDPHDTIIDQGTGLYPQYQLIDPEQGSGTNFGLWTIALSNGNYVVPKRFAANGGINRGAVFLYNGLTGELLGSMFGPNDNDSVGGGGLPVELSAPNTNKFVVFSPSWNGIRGAATLLDGSSSFAGFVDGTNSLVGSAANDTVSGSGIIALTNGNYVVASSQWNGAGSDRGAVTPMNGSDGKDLQAVPQGPGVTVSTSNSLYGTTNGDEVGERIYALTNGNYAVQSAEWNGTRGAATLMNGATGQDFQGVPAGPGVALSTSNSLTGSAVGDQVASGFGGGVGVGIVALTNGNYVVASPNWGGNLGAATLISGTNGTDFDADGSGGPGVNVLLGNSLTGSVALDQVGQRVTALTNGHCVVTSHLWDGGIPLSQRGAATWINGTNGADANGLLPRTSVPLKVTTSNSLYGTSTGDQVSVGGALALSNGNYVVISYVWTNGAGGAAARGAATLMHGNLDGNQGKDFNGLSGPGVAVSSSNSIYSNTNLSRIGDQGVFEVTDGSTFDHFVVVSASSAILIDGATGLDMTGGGPGVLVGGGNSYFISGIGSSGGAVGLTNGNYVVYSFAFSANRGQATLFKGIDGKTVIGDNGPGIGVFTATDSLLGNPSDRLSFSGGVTSFPNGKYLVPTRDWLSGAGQGAFTIGDQVSGVQGTINGDPTNLNSIVGIGAGTFAFTPAYDAVNNSFACPFISEGSGRVRVGIFEPDQITFARAQAKDMTIQPAFLTNVLDAGTDVTIQANNDTTITSPITVAGGGGDLTIRSGRNIIVNANITTTDSNLTMIGNDLLSSGVVDAQRDAGAATISIVSPGPGTPVTIDTGTGNLDLQLLSGAGKTNSTSGNLIIGNALDVTTLQTSGGGSINLFAQVNDMVMGLNSVIQSINGNIRATAGNNLVMGDTSLIQSVNGNILAFAGNSLLQSSPFTIQTTGLGNITLVVDNLFPTSPAFGTGAVNISDGFINTPGGGLLKIYTSRQGLNTLPTNPMNGTVYSAGTLFIDTATEEWNVYYPGGSSGIPFTVFYKDGLPVVVIVTPATITRGVLTFFVTITETPDNYWRFPFYGGYLDIDPYAPDKTNKGLNLILPRLVDYPETPDIIE